jgi:hypothetical protein
MILLMIAQLSMDDDDFGKQTVHISDLLDKGGISGNGYYERAAEAADQLLNQKIFVRTEAGRWRGYNLLSFVEPHPGHIVARFNPDMRPFLLQLKRRFTRYMLEHVMRFGSPYSTRIYELAQQFADIGYRTIPLDDLRHILALDEKYPRFYDFKRRVLDQARKEINRHTDLDIAYEVIREGRNPAAVKLFIRKKAAAEIPVPSKPNRKGRSADPAQQGFHFGPGGSSDEPTAGSGLAGARTTAVDPSEGPFQVWLAHRSEEERAALDRQAAERLDPFLRKHAERSPDGAAVRSALHAELRALWQEALAGGILSEPGA